ncbi:DUF7009 family protein [Mucilaginibacter paludis]|uniref:DUF7009 family protein n=1 Tax=Mucilaginibacter paludis TaxID=423351 RepID=UPI00373FE336
MGHQPLTYTLQKTDIDQLSVTFKNHEIILLVPQQTALNWTNTESVGFDHQDYSGLYLLVEKDFKCLDNVTEHQSDNYPNPLAGK